MKILKTLILVKLKEVINLRNGTSLYINVCTLWVNLLWRD